MGNQDSQVRTFSFFLPPILVSGTHVTYVTDLFKFQ